MRLPSPKLATFQVKQMMLTYNTITFLIGHTLFRVDLHLQGRTYLFSIKAGHLLSVSLLACCTSGNESNVVDNAE